ncbi:TIGR03915 family putative DNA repair protein [Sphingobacterium griseoflavum]|uniref:DNA metabolism protein n=1 Tax=Sphingobacterium griseoflavum TaxID=1474952 RepID=A0ABQ3HX56_9SPHI|nr:TIGR03915 family putative DNA repair protein [Sphingobacterium griseoflavum]GHE42402.1 DNA metabolism protein [Sphingobacterium griseoflavum]
MREVDLYFDGTWEGILTSIFEMFEYKIMPLSLSHTAARQKGMFQTAHDVVSQQDKADRVKKGLIEKIGRNGYLELWHAFLSELPDVPLLIIRLARHYFQSEQPERLNFGHDLVLRLKKIVKSVSRERHRMKAFARFQRLQDGLFVALIEPDFNVLPLIRKHFQDRYADQRWLIFDIRRHYGLYYDEHTTSEVTFADPGNLANSRTLVDLYAADEPLYADLWKRYFKSVNIVERKNMKLHLQHVPRRYWRHLHEKSFGLDA